MSFLGLGAQTGWPQPMTPAYQQYAASPFNPSTGAGSPMPLPGGLKFNAAPTPTSPWETPKEFGLPRIQGNLPIAQRLNPLREFRNPFEMAFGGSNNIAGVSKSTPSFSQEIGGSYVPSGNKAGSLAFDAGKTGSVGVDPSNLQGLVDQINSLSYDQLVELDRDNKYRQVFQNAAQTYANAYANDQYAASAPMTYDSAQNYLQHAYGTLVDRLNRSYLL